MPDGLRVILRTFSSLAASLLIIGFAATCMVRLAPGYGTDERELDARLSNASIDALRQNEANRDVFTNYYQFLRHAISGDLGFSATLHQPVGDLIRQRYSTSIRILFAGWALAWSCAILLAGGGMVLQSRLLPLAGTIAGGAVLCLPSALLAYVCFLFQGPAFSVVALVVFARVFRVVDNVFRAAHTMPHILAAKAQGISEWSIFVRHILSVSAGEIIALGGSSVAMAVSATIAAESLCDQPGLGQLAWKAALGRDLPLLVSLTFIIAAVTMLFNRGADALVKLRSAAA